MRSGLEGLRQSAAKVNWERRSQLGGLREVVVKSSLDAQKRKKGDSGRSLLDLGFYIIQNEQVEKSADS